MKWITRQQVDAKFVPKKDQEEICRAKFFQSGVTSG
jgi:hypothetical protein